MAVVANILIVSGLTVLYHFGFLEGISFALVILIVLGFLILALYSPSVVFYLLVGVVPLEILSISLVQFGFDLRPYQLLVVVLIFAIVARRVLKLSKEKMFNWNILDTLISVFVSIGFLGAGLSEFAGIALKQELVVLSFGLLYFVVRYFVRTREDLNLLFPIFISSGVVVGLYAILQNVLFAIGRTHMEVMPGRPNATFTEADWLGIYLAFVFAVCVGYLYYLVKQKNEQKISNYLLFVSTTIITSTLIITVVRSAWLGIASVSVVYLMILIFTRKYKLFLQHSLWIGSVMFFSIVFVQIFHLTTFELFNRAQSTASGLQEITVSCSDKSQLVVAEVIDNVGELEQYNCRHINLEEIETEKAKGNKVFKIYRKDPNVKVRTDVYVRTINLIKQKPLLGYGWGSSEQLLGTDENGTPLNTSNIFLETALSIGLIGLSILIMIFVIPIFFSIQLLLKDKKSKTQAIFMILITTAVIVPNLFNAGLFLAFMWVSFAMLVIFTKM